MTLGKKSQTPLLRALVVQLVAQQHVAKDIHNKLERVEIGFGFTFRNEAIDRKNRLYAMIYIVQCSTVP